MTPIPTRSRARTLALALNDEVSLRLHMRHSNSHTGVPGEWSFNGYDPLVNVNGVTQPLPPDPSEWSQLNSLLGSAELAVAAPSGWQHRFTAFDYLYRYNDLNRERRSRPRQSALRPVRLSIARVRPHQSRGI